MQTGSIAALENGDLLGCGDVNADGKDELIFRKPTTPKSQEQLIAISFTNQVTTFIKVPKFVGRTVLNFNGPGDQPIVGPFLYHGQ